MNAVEPRARYDWWMDRSLQCWGLSLAEEQAEMNAAAAVATLTLFPPHSV